MAPTLALVGTLDTKGVEYAWLVEQLEAEGCSAHVIDVGTYSSDDSIADVSYTEVAAAGGGNIDDLRSANDRGAAMEIMAKGAARLVRELHDAGTIDGILAIGGSSGSSVAARAMQALPVGVPKLLVSTMASGDVSPYVGESDICLMYSVVDIAGINQISRQVLGNAVSAAAGMARRYAAQRTQPAPIDAKPLIGATMFGLTTPAADEARSRLTELGYEVLVFHATGSGGKAMEGLIDGGFLTGVLDLTTTELADDLVGGVLSAGPHRLEAAGAKGIPQVVSVGALDMVNFGPRESVPAQFDDRQFIIHNPTITLMRTTAGEMSTLGSRIATKLADSTGAVEVFLPLQGVSGIDCPGGPFEDAAADSALFEAVRDGLKHTDIVVHELDMAINDPGFGRSMADALHQLITTSSS
jgi:uncharacterized protein (UPF0261 family)